MFLVISFIIIFIYSWIELGIGLIELGIDLRINNARRTILARVSGLVFIRHPSHKFEITVAQKTRPDTRLPQSRADRQGP